jgi:hypothetical protein
MGVLLALVEYVASILINLDYDARTMLQPKQTGVALNQADATSPKTGSADLAMILTIIAIVAASTVFFAGKQLRKAER